LSSVFLFDISVFHGQLFALLSGVFYALFIVVNRMISSVVSSYNRIFYQLLFGSFVLLPFVELTDLRFYRHELSWLFAIGFFQGYLALSLMIIALRCLHAFEYATVSYIEPIVATLAGYLVYAESLSLMQAVGCLIILASGFLQIGISMQDRGKEG